MQNYKYQIKKSVCKRLTYVQNNDIIFSLDLQAEDIPKKMIRLRNDKFIRRRI